jgi:hypothetical protein
VSRATGRLGYAVFVTFQADLSGQRIKSRRGSDQTGGVPQWERISDLVLRYFARSVAKIRQFGIRNRDLQGIPAFFCKTPVGFLRIPNVSKIECTISTA